LSCRVSLTSDSDFEKSKNGEQIVKQFKVLSVEELKLSEGTVQTAALDYALKYLLENGMDKLSSVDKINHYSSNVFMSLDFSSVRNLELMETMRGKSKRGSLLWVLDKTKTAMGKRLLRSWLIQPLLSPTEIIARHNAVDEIYGDTVLRGEMSEYMTGIFDVERLITRVVYGVANPKELQSLSHTISRFAPLKQLLQTCNCKMLKQIESDIDVLTDVASRIDATICDEPPISMKDGKIIREGFNSDVDILRKDLTGGKTYIAEIEAKEKEKTGIKALKVRYNKVFGYYIEVPAQYSNVVPEEYIRKQTLTAIIFQRLIQRFIAFYFNTFFQYFLIFFRQYFYIGICFHNKLIICF
jgi:DNA mismatch repair protein MutS